MMKPLVAITGASSGFGRAMAVTFNQAGYPLVLMARRIEKLEELGLDHTICEKVDVRDKAAFESAIRKAEAIYGKVDLLINNAGLMQLGDIATQDPKEWQDMLAINVLGVLNGMQIVMNDMKERRGGTIINFSSLAGVKAFPNHAAYCASKYGVIGLSETARQELSAYHVRVMRLLPGAVQTELLSHTTDEKIKKAYSSYNDSLGMGAISAEHIAQTVKFAYEMPQGVNLREIQIADTMQDA